MINSSSNTEDIHLNDKTNTSLDLAMADKTFKYVIVGGGVAAVSFFHLLHFVSDRFSDSGFRNLQGETEIVKSLLVRIN